MTFNSLKQLVFNKIKLVKFNENNEKNQIILGVLLFKLGNKLINIDISNIGSLDSTLSQYTQSYKSIILDLQKNYITYREMLQKIDKYKLTSFLNINENQINELYYLYEHKKIRDEFSLTKFSQYMYNITNLNEAEKNILKNIHFNVICPIIKYYSSYYNIQMYDVLVEDKKDSIVGKVINLSISNISSSRIFSDINRDVMNIKNKLFKFSIISSDLVQLIIK